MQGNFRHSCVCPRELGPVDQRGGYFLLGAKRKWQEQRQRGNAKCKRKMRNVKVAAGYFEKPRYLTPAALGSVSMTGNTCLWHWPPASMVGTTVGRLMIYQRHELTGLAGMTSRRWVACRSIIASFRYTNSRENECNMGAAGVENQDVTGSGNGGVCGSGRICAK